VSVPPGGCEVVSKTPPQEKRRIVNKRASFEYELLERVEAGIALKGSEVKSLREGNASIAEAYARVGDGVVELIGCQIDPYSHGTTFNHEPKRIRQLLLHRREIRRLASKVQIRGLTLVPTCIYFNEKGLAKVELAVARGKSHRDKRQDLRAREDRRDMQRARQRWK
jgi:SsrA-binding protein